MQKPNLQASTRLSIVQRKPKRISITLPFHVWDTLVSHSDEQGRSFSNLAAFVIEEGLITRKEPKAETERREWRRTG